MVSALAWSWCNAPPIDPETGRVPRIAAAILTILLLGWAPGADAATRVFYPVGTNSLVVYQLLEDPAMAIRRVGRVATP